MTARMFLAGFALILGCLVVVLLSAGSPTPRSSVATTGTHAARIPRGPRLSERQINRQDRTTEAQARREARAFDQRPLLNELPTIYEGVGFDIGGLAHDDRTTIILIDAKAQGRRRALIAYRALRRKVGDRSRDYEVRVRP